jgi:hypothetical protein
MSPVTVTFSPGRGIPITSCASPEPLDESVTVTLVSGGSVATVQVTRVTGFVP